MSGFVGTINVNLMSGTLNVGDVHTISPLSFFRTYAGSGSFNSGNYLDINNANNVTNVYEAAGVFDQTTFVPGGGP